MSNLSYPEIIRELENIAREQKLPEETFSFRFEKQEFYVRLGLSAVSEETMSDVIMIAKRHIENWRVHTFEKGLMTLQALNENLFSTENLFERMKLRLSGLYGEKLLEITKKGSPTPNELSLISALIKHLTRKNKKKDIWEDFRHAGCTVFAPDAQSTFSDFAGYNRVKDKIREIIILPLKNPEIYDSIAQGTRKKFEINRPRAVLFAGPPGVGKTSMARIIGAEANLHVVVIPLENIMSAYYGESTKRLAMIFDIAGQAEDTGLIFFLDEIDALAPSRNEKLFEATRRLLSVLLRKIEGLESRSNYLTVGATNRPSDLDPALLSRFDTILEFPMPSTEDVAEIIKLYAKQLGNPEISVLAQRLTGISPRAIKDICRNAERIYAREILISGKTTGLPQMEHYERAFTDFDQRENAIISSVSASSSAGAL